MRKLCSCLDGRDLSSKKYLNDWALDNDYNLAMYILGFIRTTEDQETVETSIVYKVEAYWRFIYWLPTSTNFLIYIISTQYRQAYIIFLKRLNDFIKNKNSQARRGGGQLVPPNTVAARASMVEVIFD